MLLDTAYCAPRDVDLDGRVVSRDRFGSFDLLEVSSEAGDQLWTGVTASR